MKNTSTRGKGTDEAQKSKHKRKDGDKKEIQARKKRKRQELREILKDQVNDWSQGEAQRDEITEKTREVFCKVGKATTELIRKVIRDGMETERTNKTEETYKYDEYIILGASWGQFVEGERETRRRQYSEAGMQAAAS